MTPRWADAGYRDANSSTSTHDGSTTGSGQNEGGQSGAGMPGGAMGGSMSGGPMGGGMSDGATLPSDAGGGTPGQDAGGMPDAGSGGMGSPDAGGGSSTMDGGGMSMNDAGSSGNGESGRLVGITAAHNAVRSEQEAGIPPLEWDPDLAETAQSWADTLANGECTDNLRHSGTEGLGENIAAFYNSMFDNTTSEEVVRSWASEKACYTFGRYMETDSCMPGPCEGAMSCGHYTQVVWRETERVGCGMATCDGWEIWVCNYSPPGNVIGQEPY